MKKTWNWFNCMKYVLNVKYILIKQLKKTESCPKHRAICLMLQKNAHMLSHLVHISCSSGAVSELQVHLDCLPLREGRRLISNREKTSGSIHTSCCTLEPKYLMILPENPLSSQYDTLPAISSGLISNENKREAKC